MKVFGIDNISGEHRYVSYLPNFTGFNNGQQIRLLIQRTSKHFPHQAQCTILARHRHTGNAVLYQFNPITGKTVAGGHLELNYAIRQATLLQPRDDFLKPLLIFDKFNRLHVFPEQSTRLAHGTYIYAADKETGVVTGYFVEASNEVGHFSGVLREFERARLSFPEIVSRRNVAHQSEWHRQLAKDH